MCYTLVFMYKDVAYIYIWVLLFFPLLLLVLVLLIRWYERDGMRNRKGEMRVKY